jgi:hypothetical protein
MTHPVEMNKDNTIERMYTKLNLAIVGTNLSSGLIIIRTNFDIIYRKHQVVKQRRELDFYW